MHDSVRAFKEANERDRRLAEDLANQIDQAETHGVTLLHKQEIEAKIAMLRENVDGYEVMIADYAEAVSSGDSASAAYRLVMIQIMQAMRQELDAAHNKIEELNAVIQEAVRRPYDDPPPDAS